MRISIAPIDVHAYELALYTHTDLTLGHFTSPRVRVSYSRRLNLTISNLIKSHQSES